MQSGVGGASRDWLPISFMGTVRDWAEMMDANDVKNDWGQLSCGCHPNCGTGMAVMIDKETKEAVPVTAFLHGGQFARDIAKVKDAARGEGLTAFGMGLWLMKDYDPYQSPTHFKPMELFEKFDKKDNASDYLKLREEIVTNELQRDLDKLGIAKNAREEKVRARDAKQKQNAEARGPEKNDSAYNARMASLYREVVLKEKPVQSQDGFIPLRALAEPNGDGKGVKEPKPE